MSLTEDDRRWLLDQLEGHRDENRRWVLELRDEDRRWTIERSAEQREEDRRWVLELRDAERQWVLEQFREHRELLETVETRLLTEFHKWASPMEARQRTHTATLRAIDLELESLNERVKRLEEDAA